MLFFVSGLRFVGEGRMWGEGWKSRDLKGMKWNAGGSVLSHALQ